MVVFEEMNKRIGKIEKAISEIVYLDSDNFEFILPNKLEDLDAEFVAGITKGCISFSDCPYVIKYGLDGYLDDDDKCVDFEENSVMNELDIYNYFKSFKLEKLLAKTWKRDDNFIYAEKVIPIYDYWVADYSIELSKEENEWFEKNKYKFPFRSYWLKAAIKEYGIEYFENFVKLAKKEFDFFSDLHEGNYGFNLHNSPKILDWGGMSCIYQINS